MMKKILFMCFFVFLVHYNCLGQILSLQVNAAGGKYFYLTRDIYDQSYQVTYSGGWTGALETNLIVNKLGFPWLGLNVGMGLKNCYRRETLRHHGYFPPPGPVFYTLSEAKIRWNFMDIRLLPEIKILKKQRLYVFGGYYYGLLYRNKGEAITKTNFGTNFPIDVDGGADSKRIYGYKEMKEWEYRTDIHGVSFGFRYLWRNFAVQIRDDYAKAGAFPPISYNSFILFNNHTLTTSIGYNIDFFK